MTDDAPATPAVAKPRKRTTWEVLRALGQPKVAIMFGLGFGSGLPFLLTAGTLGYWLRDTGASLRAIGFIAWVGLAYSFKFLWSPIVDRVDLPLFGILGRRRGWLLFTQIVVAAGLVAMAAIGPKGGLAPLGLAAVVVAFASATQDIVVDALRIEAAAHEDELGLFSAAFQLGYRVAVIVSDSLILFAANHFGWPLAYDLMAVCMAVGEAATFIVREPRRADIVLDAKTAIAPLWTPRGLFDAVTGPFVAFFSAFGWMALLLLVMISLYRLPEFAMGPMAAPFYHDLHLSKDLVGAVRGSFGLAGSLVGIAVGGFLAAQLGGLRALVVGGVLQAAAIASFAFLTIFPPAPSLFAAVMFGDNFGVGIAGVALVTYMSGLTSLGYTATQYALLTSAYTWVGKTLKGFTGEIVEGLQHQGHTLMQAYAIFFIGCGLVGLPAILLCLWLSVVRRKPVQPAASADGASALTS